MIFSNRYAREAAGFSAGKVSRIEKGQLWVYLLQFRWIKGGRYADYLVNSGCRRKGLPGRSRYSSS